MSDRYRRGNGGMMLVAHELEILVDIVEQSGRPPADVEAGRRKRSARELQSRLLQMIEVQMAVAARPDEFSGLEVALLREHVGEQGVARNVEGDAEEDIRAALIKLTGQPAVRHVELKQRVARHEVHLLELAHVPRADQDAAGIRIAAQQLERHADLIDGASVGCQPFAPLLAVNRSQLAALVGPFVPNADTLVAQPGDVGVAPQEPEKLVDDRAQMDPLRGDQRESLREIEAQLLAEERQRPGARAVTLACAAFQDAAHQIQVGLHRARLTARWRSYPSACGCCRRRSAGRRRSGSWAATAPGPW